MPQLPKLNKKDDLNANNDFSSQQKKAVIFLAVLSLMIVIAWVLQVNYQIRKPFQLPEQSTKNSINDLNSALIDLDGDGLSDYDEVNIYLTSPYVEDSDSDGISDYDEVIQGTDPNCASGKNCYAGSDLINQNSPGTEALLETEANREDLPGDDSQNSEMIFNPAEVTPDILRQVLLGEGYEKEILDQISDEDLMTSYQEALKVHDENILE